jgi:hypothetical protein
MQFEIIIKRKRTVTQIERGQWALLEKRPWTDKELADASPSYSGKEKFLETNPLKEVNGYRPEREVLAVEETEILKQTVETLDLAAVIKAINGL